MAWGSGCYRAEPHRPLDDKNGPTGAEYVSAQAMAELIGALDEIIQMGHDCPAGWPGDETEWEAHRARMMKGIALYAIRKATKEFV
ncbi:MAG: hypothetical protein ACRC14_18920 [Paracoccaceae bacterium]